MLDEATMALALGGASADGGDPPMEGDEPAEFVGGDARLDGLAEQIVGDDPMKKQALYDFMQRCEELKHADSGDSAEDDDEGY